MNKITKGKSIGMILLATLMACVLLVSTASALASTPASPTDPAGGGERVEPLLPRWRSQIIMLEMDSDEQGHYDAIGQAYYAHRDFWPPCWNYVTGRSDTEADAHILSGVNHTEVKVWIWLQREFMDGRWITVASGHETRNYPIDAPNGHEYDVDVVVRAPLFDGGAYWRTTTLHQVYRDRVRTGSGSHTTPRQWIYSGSWPTEKPSQ